MLYSSGVRRFKDTHTYPEWLALNSGLNANSRASWTGTVTWLMPQKLLYLSVYGARNIA
jgi:hypothetical protein